MTLQLGGGRLFNMRGFLIVVFIENTKGILSKFVVWDKDRWNEKKKDSEKTKNASATGNTPTDQVNHLVNQSVTNTTNGTSDDAGQTRQQPNMSKEKEVAQLNEKSQNMETRKRRTIILSKIKQISNGKQHTKKLLRIHFN